MADKTITFNILDAIPADYIRNGGHNWATNTFSMRLASNVITQSAALNATVTEVTGDNYSAGGITLATTIQGTAPNERLNTVTSMVWNLSAGGFTDAATAVLYNNTTSEILAVADLRTGGVPVSSVTENVTITLTGGNLAGTGSTA